MSRKHKTVHLRTLIEEINSRNRSSTCSRDVRKGWNAILDSVLIDANVYAGFGYLSPKDVPKGHLPGIARPLASGQHIDKASFPDDSRIVFYVDEALQKDRR
jgi:hypothetical protein